LPQQHHAPVAGQVPAAEIGLDQAPSKLAKLDAIFGTLWHGETFSQLRANNWSLKGLEGFASYPGEISGLAAQKSSGSAATAGDVDILNSALAAEHKGIAAYDVGAHSGLLQKPALDLAIQFQGHHKAHADLLAATIRKLGARR
jgi:hypothetical protein